MEYSSYRELEKDLEGLYEHKKYREIVDLLGRASNLLPQEEFEKNYFGIELDKACFSTNCNMYDECIKTLIKLVDEGYACPLYWERFEPLKDDKRYVELKQKNDRLIEQAEKIAKPEYVVHLPEGYSENKQYPLFINLHGDGENMKQHSQHWKPDNFLNKDFIVVYIQSSQVIHHTGYGWLSDPLKSRKDVKEVFNIIVEQYPIDEKSIIIGGFSGGAIASIDITMTNELPVKGFIALCADEMPKSFTNVSVKSALDRGIKGVLMEGEYDIPVPAEEEMIAIFKEVGFPYEYYINKGIGHWYPEDLNKKVEQALDFIG